MVFKSVDEIFATGSILCENEEIIIANKDLFRTMVIEDIVDTIIFSENEELKRWCYWITHVAGGTFGAIPSSIRGLYEACGRGGISGFTVPAINLRSLTFDLARAIFRAAKRIDAGAFIFEIAISEIEYTYQRPMEYTSMIILAAIKEGYQGALFIQGDHYQVNSEQFFLNREQEIARLEHLIEEAIEALFFNLDIDSSTLVDLSKPNLDQQQNLNYEICAYLTKYVRQLQPNSLDISIGGEIGEVGGKNSTSDELRAFMNGYMKQIGEHKGISKLSIQAGTTHGGIVLPDGSIAQVKIDFDTLKGLSEVARKEYGLAGCVQHGASTLPQEAFHHFPEKAIEIHLATQFQNIVFDYLPLSMKEDIYNWLEEFCQPEIQSSWTKDQFIYRMRKKAFGPFKKEIHSLSADLRKKIASVLEKEFSFLFEQLNIGQTKELVDKHVTLLFVDKTKEDFFPAAKS